MDMKVEGLTELADNIDVLLARQYPKLTDKFLKKEGTKANKVMRQVAKGTVKKITGNYHKGFTKGRKVYDWNDNSRNLMLYNKSFHAHLIEYGHRVVSKTGKATGKYVPGKHVMEIAIKQFENQFTHDVENDLGEFIVKELEKNR